MKKFCFFAILITFLPFGKTQAQDMNNPAYGPNLQQRQMIEWQNQPRREESAAQAEADAETNRRWWAEEKRILKNIQRLKEKPFWGAIAMDVGTSHTSWGGGYSSKTSAINAAMENCKTSNCKIIALFFNSCAMTTMPDNDKGNINSISIGFDKNGRKAIEKSYHACETKYGQGNCSYAGNGKDAFCSGYDYGIYKE